MRGDARSVYGAIHSPEYIERILGEASSGSVSFIDPDTYVSEGTLRALERLAGAVVEAMEYVERGETYILILGRPPGHHAGVRGAALGAATLGFCIFNTAAALAVGASRMGRVAVLDFDLHHGNGTQEILWDTSILHVDIHQDPRTIYPGTGYPWEKGLNGNLVNILLPPSAGDDIFMDAVGKGFERITEYDPDYLVVSAGFDAYYNDFGSMRVTEEGYKYLASRIKGLRVPVVAVLEGGYSSGLSRGLPAFAAGLAGAAAGYPHTLSSDSLWEAYRGINDFTASR